MQRIGLAAEAERKRQRNVQIFSMALLALMVFSSIGYAFFSNPNAGTVGQSSGYEGVRQVGGRWAFGQADKTITLAYSPEEASNSTEVGQLQGISSFVSEPLFIDSTDPVVTSEIAGALGYYASRMQEACYGSCGRDLPEKGCQESNMIVWRESNQSRVYQQDKCVFIEGDLKAVDAYVYSLFGILPS